MTLGSLSDAVRTPLGDSFQKKAALLVVILGPFMAQLDSTLVNLALNAIREDFGAEMRVVQWVTSGYLTALALALPLNTWLLSWVGVRRLYLLCFALFTATSVFCGFSTSLPQLIAGRVFQGMAGGLLAPLTQFMLARIAGPQLARVIGITAAPILLAPLIGPTIAGWVLRLGRWPWLFALNVPLGLLGLFLASRFLPEDFNPPSEEMEGMDPQKEAFDGLGFLLLGPGLAALLLGCGGHGLFDAPWKSWALMAMGGVLLLLFGVRSHRLFSPLDSAVPHSVQRIKPWIDLQLLQIPAFSAALLTQFLVNGILFSGQFLMPLYFISGVGLSPDQAGLRLSVIGAGLILIYPGMGYLTDRFGAVQVARWGSRVALLGVLPFLVMSYFGIYEERSALVGLFLRGVGQGATGVPSLALAYLAVPQSRFKGAATTVNLFQRLGGPLLTLGVSAALSMDALDAGSVGLSGGTTSRGVGDFVAPFAVLTFFHIAALWATSRLIQSPSSQQPDR